MSIHIVGDVWDHSQADGSALLVLLALADNADRATRLAWPSIADLSRRTRIGERNVQRHLRKIEHEFGEIETVRPGGRVNGRYRATVYRVKLGVAQESPLEEAGVTEEASRGGAEGKGGVTAPPPQPSKGTVKGTVKEKKVDLDVDEIGPAATKMPKAVNGHPVGRTEAKRAAEALAAFNEIAGTGIHSEAALKKIIGRIREHPKLSVADHRLVIEKAFVRPWWEGPPTPAVVYGNAELFDRAVAKAFGAKSKRQDRAFAENPDQLKADVERWFAESEKADAG